MHDDEECGSDSEEGSGEEDDNHVLGATLSDNALARTLVDTQTANDLGLVRAEVGHLRSKIRILEREKDDMVDNFRDTTRILLDRIKALETELSETKSRPQTAVIIERIEKPLRAGANGGSSSSTHAPEVLRIPEEPAEGGAEAEVPVSPVEEKSKCGNCGKDIPAGNLISHNLYCYSNNWRCTACDEVIHIREKESHLEKWTDPCRLLEAASRRDKDLVQRIAEHGLDLNAATHPQTRDTVMHVAARLGDVDLIGFFVAFGVDVDPVNESGETPLHLAAEVADPAAKLLVELGAELNLANGKGETPLMLVCRRGASETAKFLVENKADPEVCTRLGDTPLQIAQRLGFQETVLALCMAGAPLRSGTPSRSRGGSPLPRQAEPPPRGGGGTAAGNAGYPPLPRKQRVACSPKRSLQAVASEGRLPAR